ncbi:MAG TPA: hypothetical protein VLV17_01755 [Anaeromyxobacteraceae bacterium]|nr:hypothetical protein [Anaeromyxobacteraceae bacterium]
MWKVFFGLLLVAGVAAAVAFVPVRGRTVLDRWNAAHTPAEFLERSLAEAKVALGLRHPGRSPARATKVAPHPLHKAAPVEQISDKDRAAMDRLVAEHAR